MSEQVNLKKNIGYQTLYQLLNTCVPLITSPYLARSLGATSQGIFSYTQSIVNYFTLLAMLGVVNYGTRVIAACGDSKAKRNEEFWSIYIFQIITSLISIIMYIIYLILVCKDNIHIAIIQGLYLVGALLDVNWFFFGIEKIDLTVKRSIVIRILSLLSILCFIKDPNDLWIYTLIMAGSTFVSNSILFIYLKSEVDFKSSFVINKNQITKHIKPNLYLFVPLLAMSVFHIMDKTMLGVFSTYEQTGYYYNADKIINIPIGIITGIGTVMLPRMTRLNEKGDTEESNRVFNITLEFIVLISSCMTFGIAAIAPEFTPLFFGNGFEPCIQLIVYLSPVLVLKSLSNTSRMQFLIPKHLERVFIESVIFGAIINLIVNIALIPKFGALGAVLGTLSAELLSCIWQFVRMRKYIVCLRTLFNSMIYIFFGIIMYIVVRMCSQHLTNFNLIISIVLEVIIGGIVYILLAIGNIFINTKSLIKNRN